MILNITTLPSVTLWRVSGARNPRMCGLLGVADAVMLRRHSPDCRPGLWQVSLTCGTEVFDMFRLNSWRVDAVQDDFGNLVRVSP